MASSTGRPSSRGRRAEKKGAGKHKFGDRWAEGQERKREFSFAKTKGIHGDRKGEQRRELKAILPGARTCARLDPIGRSKQAERGAGRKVNLVVRGRQTERRGRY